MAFVPSTGGVGNATLAIEPSAIEALGAPWRSALLVLRLSDDMRDRRLLRGGAWSAVGVHVYSRHCDVAGLTYGAKITQTATSRPIAEFCAGKGG